MLIHRMISKSPTARPDDPTMLMRELRKIKIDMDEGWDELIERLTTTDTALASHASTVSEARLQATQQLQTVMKGNVKSWWTNSKTWGTLALLSILALLGGLGVAMSFPPDSLLDVEDIVQSGVPKEGRVEDQYEAAYWGTYALGEGDEQKKIDYWKAVIDFFPLEHAPEEKQHKTALYHRRAQARLGEVYLSQKKLSEALVIYEELEDCESLSEHFCVMGIAGKAIVYDFMPAEEFTDGENGREQKIRQCLGEIGSRLDLLNQFMRQAIEGIKERYPALQTLPPAVDRHNVML